MLERLDGQGRVALGAILGAVVAALCCVGFFTAKDDGPGPVENMLPLALTSAPSVATGVAGPTTVVRPIRTVVRATLTTAATTVTTTAAVTTTKTAVATTTGGATTTVTTTQQATSTPPPPTTTTTRHRCSWLIC